MIWKIREKIALTLDEYIQSAAAEEVYTGR